MTCPPTPPGGQCRAGHLARFVERPAARKDAQAPQHALFEGGEQAPGLVKELRRLRWRSGRLRTLVVKVRLACIWRAISAHGMTRTQLAASSIASGIPSTCVQIAAIASSCPLPEKAGCTRWALRKNSCPASPPTPRPATGRRPAEPLFAQVQPLARGNQQLDACCTLEQLRDGVSSLLQVLEVVQDQQQAAALQVGRNLCLKIAARDLEAQALGDRANTNSAFSTEAKVTYNRHRRERLPVWRAAPQWRAVSCRSHQRRARSEPAVRVGQQSAICASSAPATDEGCGLQRQIVCALESVAMGSGQGPRAWPAAPPGSLSACRLAGSACTSAVVASSGVTSNSQCEQGGRFRTGPARRCAGRRGPAGA